MSNPPAMQSRSFGFDPLFDTELITHALAEDIGRGDVTTDATIPPGTRATGRLLAKAAGVIAGLPVAERAFRLLDPAMTFAAQVHDSAHVEPGQTLAQIEGDARALLTAERTALNFLGRLSGIATLTARCVAATEGTRATVVDTRKTTPGLRALEKYAVRMGGGHNHRAGLDDGILIKDNHIVAAGGIARAVQRARASASHLLRVEVECETEAQVREAVAAGVEVILLDNMTPEQMRAQVAWIREHAPYTLVEASGNIGTDAAKLAAVAATGVDLISLGALTHSAPNFDVSLELDAQPSALPA